MPSAARKKSKSPTTSLEGIRVLSIGQPWAELILLGRKPFEIRSWERSYRGPLLIHASKRWNASAAAALRVPMDKLSLDAIVGIAELSEIRPFTKEDARLLEKKRA